MIKLPFFTILRCQQLVPTTKQLGIQARVVEHLKRYGSITALEIQRMGTTDARKLASRLRRQGFITRTEMEPNATGGSKHARYFCDETAQRSEFSR